MPPSGLVHSDLDLLVQGEGTVEADRAGDPPWTLSAASLGALRLVSGRVVAGDPFVGALSEPPLDRRLPPGAHPVSLAVVRLAPDHLRVAGLVLRVEGARVQRWERACWEDGTPAELGVDAGTLALACAERAPGLDTEAHGAALLAAFNETTLGCRHPDAPDAVVAASSGWGDGLYTAWWGLDAAGQPVALVLDTDVLVVPIWETATVPLPLPWRWSSAGIPALDAAGVRVSRAFWRSGVVRGTGLRRMPRLRVGPPGGTLRTVAPATVAGVTTWRLGTVEPGDELELGLVVGRRPARRLDG